MTENEAIKVLEEKYLTMSMCGNIEKCKRNNQAISGAIDALNEIQQYRVIGTVEQVSDMKQNYVEALSDWRQYRKIGTVKECQKGVERQKMKKPEIKIHRYSSSMHCPNCKFRMVSKIDSELIAGSQAKYCHNCGQSIDWSE